MQIDVRAVGTRLEPWIYQAFESYQARLPRHLKLSLSEVPMARRSGGASPVSAMAVEGDRLLKSVRPDDFALALDERGRQWSSAELATEIREWQERYPRIAILIGGPDGLSPGCRERADGLWSLSRLTFPHGLVRVLLVEQIYRAWTILQGHPYHRA
jgi:23S rRNA (pseudouridine1915-N3)-methyltransferase